MPSFPDKVAQLGMDPTLAKTLQDNIGGNRTAVQALTPLTGAFGTPGSAIVDVTGAFSQSILNNNFRALEDKINAAIAAMKT